jgi:pseudouridine synthase
MNPEHEAPKTYLVEAATVLSGDQLEHLRRKVGLDDGPTEPAQVLRSRDSGKHSFIDLTIRKGRNREVRRMVEAVGSRVLKLVRTSVGPLRLGSLGIGRYRELTPEEVKSLFPGSRRKPSKPAGPPPGRRR